jgi:hypothetical protein
MSSSHAFCGFIIAGFIGSYVSHFLTFNDTVQLIDISTMAVSLRKLLLCIMVVLAVALPCTSAKEAGGILDTVKEQFASLEPRGKFSVGAAVGFVGSRLALRSAITAVKVAGVALVVYV